MTQATSSVNADVRSELLTALRRLSVGEIRRLRLRIAKGQIDSSRLKSELNLPTEPDMILIDECCDEIFRDKRKKDLRNLLNAHSKPTTL